MNNNYELYHHGVLGMKWGVRRYQNKDGSLTDAGKKKSPDKIRKAMQKQVNKARADRYGNANRWMRGIEIGKNSDQVRKKLEKNHDEYSKSDSYKKALKKNGSIRFAG